MTASSNKIYDFGPFRLDCAERVLLRDGQPVPLTLKAFDVLSLLVENSGHIVEKSELMNRVWAGSFVEEGNLKVTVSMLRKALADNNGSARYIETVPRRGYRFLAQVNSANAESIDLVMHELTRETVTIEQEQTITSRPRRNFLPLWLGAALLILIVMIGGFFWLRSRTQSLPAVRAITPNISKLATTFNVRDAALSPDGQYVLYVRSDEGIKSIWLGQTSAGHSLQISQLIDADMFGLTFAPDGNSLYYVISGADYPNQTLFKMATTGGLPRQVLTRINSPITFSPDGRRIAYVRRHAAGGNELVIAGAEDGTNERVVARRGREDYFSVDGPAWSPDGLTIALGQRYQTNRPHSRMVSVSIQTGESKALGENAWDDMGHVSWLTDGSGLVFVARAQNSVWTHQVWLLPFPGGEARALTNDVISYVQGLLSVSKDGGSLLAMQMQNNYQLYVAPDRDPMHAQKIDMGAAGQQFPLFDPAWTPDGRIVHAVVSGESRTLWLMDADGGNRKQITPEGEIARYPSATSDGRHIIYQSTRGGRTDIWRIGVDGSNPKQVTNDGVSYHPHTSPDGKWVAYVSSRTGEERIWRVPTDGGEAVLLTDKPSDWPRVSPDGTLIACSFSDGANSARAQLATIPAAGGPPLRTFGLTRTGTFNDGVRWSHDGRSIIFRDYRFGAWRQPLAGGPSQALHSFEKLKIYDIDWSLDGKRMVYTTGAQVRVVTLIRDFR
jgi:Tol biopolymer transport system component/DNA-binding winged helix-turn-helix (wHTH) protein